MIRPMAAIVIPSGAGRISPPLRSREASACAVEESLFDFSIEIR
jgi:hypothetical protein